MNITSLLNRLIEIKEDIKDAISTKLGIEAGDNMATYAEKIRMISSEQGLFYEGLMAIEDMNANHLVSGTFLKYAHSSEIQKITARGMNYNPNLESIRFPECTEIEAYALDHCTSLAEAYLPVCSTLGEGAFQDCKSLADITLGDITTIPNNTFKNCTALPYIDLYGVTSVGNAAFQGCKNLDNITVSTLDNIGGNAFNNTHISSVNFKSGVTIGGNAFSNTYLTSVDLSNVSSLGTYVFSGCNRLESVNLSGLDSIPGGTFQNNYLLQLPTIPTYITSFGDGNTFANCYSTMSIVLDHSFVPSLGNQNPNSTYTGQYNIFGSQIVFVQDSLYSRYANTLNWRELVEIGKIRPKSELENLGSYKPYLLRNLNYNSSVNLNSIIEGYTGVFCITGTGRIPMGTYGSGTSYGNSIIVFNREGAANPYWRDSRFTFLEVPNQFKGYTATWNQLNGSYPMISFFLMTERSRFSNDENKGGGSFTKTCNSTQINQMAEFSGLWMPIVLKCVPDGNFSFEDLNLEITFTLMDDTTKTIRIV